MRRVRVVIRSFFSTLKRHHGVSDLVGLFVVVDVVDTLIQSSTYVREKLPTNTRSYHTLGGTVGDCALFLPPRYTGEGQDPLELDHQQQTTVPASSIFRYVEPLVNVVL